MPDTEDILRHLRGGLRSSRELQDALNVSQSTVSRLLLECGDRVLRFGRARSTRYIAARELFGRGFTITLFTADDPDAPEILGVLRSTADGSFVLETKRSTPWLLGREGNGVFPGLPYFLEDLRPSGYLGRLLARRLARSSAFPTDPGQWCEEQLGRMLLAVGHLLPGDLLLGDENLQRASVFSEQIVEDPEREYPVLARRAIEGEPAGSFVAGEQPKFTAWRPDRGHVIVKFSPAGRSPAAIRWQDLLHAESIAQEILRQHGLPSARTEAMRIGDRVYLESVRFDRAGRRGRAPMISLAAIDAEFAASTIGTKSITAGNDTETITTGSDTESITTGSGWARAALLLRSQGLLAERDVHRMFWLEAFGHRIGNTDMHFGNLSFAPADGGFRLLPAYDMLPMALAPVHGEIPRRAPRIPSSRPSTRISDEIAEEGVHLAAREFWNAVALDTRISAGFRRLADRYAKSIA